MATDHAFSKDFSVLGGLTFFSKSIENKLFGLQKLVETGTFS